MPKVSFVLPAYKRRFLREAIASILAQTFRDFLLALPVATATALLGGRSMRWSSDSSADAGR